MAPVSGARGSSAATHLAVPEAADQVIVDHARGLHERVADRRADEAEAPPPQLRAHRVRLRRARRHVLHASPAIVNGLTVDEPPDVRVEAAKLALHGEKG